MPANRRYQEYLCLRLKRELCVLLVVILGVLGIIGYIAIAKKSTDIEAVCRTKDCIATAADIVSKMNTKVEPCDDFYEFACGRYVTETVIPKDEVSINEFSKIGETVKAQLKTIITKKRGADEPKVFQLPNLLYRACMDTDKIDALETSPVASIFKELAAWPVVHDNRADLSLAWRWQDQLTKLFRRGFSASYLFSVEIEDDFINGTKRLIGLDQASLGLDREYLTKGSKHRTVKAYFEYMVDVAVLFGADRRHAELELHDSLMFEIALAELTLSNEERRDITKFINYLQLSKFQAMYPYVDWLTYINDMLPPGLNVTGNEIINVAVVGFFKDLGVLLAKTPDRVIGNYIMWRAHMYSVPFLSKKFRDREFKYEAILSGQDEPQDRWELCVDSTVARLPISIGGLYIKEYFNGQQRSTLFEMFANLKETFGMMLQDLNWMDDLTKHEAQKKLKAMTAYVGFPEEMKNHSILDEYHSGLSIDSSKYFESYLNLNVFFNDKMLGRLRAPLLKTDWTRHAKPTIVNAFYAPFDNCIELPAAVLQGYVFNANRPQYMNYGTIGYAIGHEITHGFDDSGRRFDERGTVRDWWQQKPKRLFLDKAQCIIKQYGNYKELLTGLKLNGVNAQGENIADNGGIKESYLAYQRWLRENGREPTLPGLEGYSEKQMFWLAAAQLWCSKDRKEWLEGRILSDSHSPTKFRVLGPFSNSQYFARDFHCKEGSPMNPPNKCEVW